MAVTLDEISFYEPRPQQAVRRPKLSISKEAIGHSAQPTLSTDRNSRRDPILIEIPVDEDHVTAAPAVKGPSTAASGSANQEIPTCASVLPHPGWLAIKPSSQPSSDRPTTDPFAATSAAAPGNIIPGVVASRTTFEPFHSNEADLCRLIGVQPDPKTCSDDASAHQDPQTVPSPSLSQMMRGELNTGDHEPAAPITGPRPNVDSSLEAAIETPGSAPASYFVQQTEASMGKLFPHLSSIPGFPLITKPRRPGPADHDAAGPRSPTRPPSLIDDTGQGSATRPMSSRDEQEALSSPIDLPRRSQMPSPSVAGSQRNVSPVDVADNQPLTSSGPRRDNGDKPLSPVEPTRARRCSARLQSVVHQAPPNYLEVSDSSSDDASGGEESYTYGSSESEREGASALKRRRSRISSEATGSRGRSRRRLSSSSTTMPGCRQARTRGFISPPISRDPSELGSEEGGSVISFQEWPLDATLKHFVDGGVETFQIQFSRVFCTKTGHHGKAHEKVPKARQPRPAKSRGPFTPFTTAEDELLVSLKEEERISWKELHERFTKSYPGRSMGALQVRYSTKLKARQT